MRKYWAFYKIGLSNAFAYRGSMVVWKIGNLLGLITLIAVWLASKSSSGFIGGYTREGLVTYYILVTFLNWVVLWTPTSYVNQEIKEGDINSRLLKPASYFWQKFAHELAWHTISPLLGLVSIFVLLLILQTNIFLNLSAVTILPFLLSITLATQVYFLLAFCMGLLSFWFIEIHALSTTIWMGLWLFGGQGIPISFFPKNLEVIIKLLPFRYVFSFPLEIYLQRLSNPEIFIGLIMQVIWIGILGFLYRILWDRGLKIYSAYGG